MRRLVVLFTALLTLAAFASPALAYDFPSTNAENCANDNACVAVVDTAPGEVTLQFDNPDSYAVCFEFRTDGDTSQATGDPNFNPAVEDLYPFLCTGGRSPQTVVETFTAEEFVEIRSAFGAERDQDFDWTRFDVGEAPQPQSKDDCKRGGWQDFGFRNQGQCIRFVNTGQDSR